MPPIKNKYDFKFIIACTNTNPNGDPDMGNMPRVNPETMIGYITDGATKRHVRDYLSLVHGSEPGMNLAIEAESNLNRKIAEAKELAGVKISDHSKAAVNKSRVKACETFCDVRTFGAVMTTGDNSGQVRGPVQINFGTSIDPVQPQDIAITRVSATKKASAKSAADYKADENQTDIDKLRTIGRKQFIPFGMYEIHGHISPYVAQQTGFDEKDLAYFFEALANMYETLHSASKGLISVVSPVIIFKHVGDPNQPQDAQDRSAMLGRAPAHKLFELVSCHKKDGIGTPTSYRDYDCTVSLSKKPRGVEIGFLPCLGENITWNKLPDGEDWVQAD